MNEVLSMYNHNNNSTTILVISGVAQFKISQRIL